MNTQLHNLSLLAPPGQPSVLPAAWCLSWFFGPWSLVGRKLHRQPFDLLFLLANGVTHHRVLFHIGDDLRRAILSNELNRLLALLVALQKLGLVIRRALRLAGIRRIVWSLSVPLKFFLHLGHLPVVLDEACVEQIVTFLQLIFFCLAPRQLLRGLFGILS